MEFTDICIITEDVLRVVEFYEKIFDCKAEGDSVHSFIRAHGLGIAIYDKNTAMNDMGFEFNNTGTGLITIGYNVKDVD